LIVLVLSHATTRKNLTDPSALYHPPQGKKMARSLRTGWKALKKKKGRTSAYGGRLCT